MAFIPAELIKKKRDKGVLSKAEIEFFIGEYSAGRLPDYQMAAWLMAGWLNGFSNEETQWLTQTMLHSGDVMDFSHIKAKKVDKHSTGGVGDKTSLILAPIVAAAGLAVPMISGRGLGHSGGTLDKLESIPGFVARVSETKFKAMVEKHGLCFMGQTDSICPADKKIYALRDVTGTVESIPLICASIMSKKLAEGIDALVLDVKFGSGAFMKTLALAENLATQLLSIGRQAGKKATALLTNMEQPLGEAVGNVLEVEECLSILRGEQKPEFADTRELSLELSAHMLFLGEAAKDLASGRAMAEKILATGQAIDKFEIVCREHGGDLHKLPKSKNGVVFAAPKDGYLTSFDNEQIGLASLALGAGRLTSDEKIDATAGLLIHKKLGAMVSKGEPLFTLFGSKNVEDARNRLEKAVRIGSEKPKSTPLIAKVL